MDKNSMPDAGVMSGVEDTYGCTKSDLEAGFSGKESIVGSTKSDQDEVAGQIGD